MMELKKPYETTLADERIRLFPDEVAVEAWRKRYPSTNYRIGIFVCFMYRNHPEVDHIKAYVASESLRVVTYDQREMLIWMGGVALNHPDSRILQLANRNNDSFKEQVGWNPLVSIKDEPTEDEWETYISYQDANIDIDWDHFFDED